MTVPEQSLSQKHQVSLSQKHQASFLRAEWGCDSPKDHWWRISNLLPPNSPLPRAWRALQRLRGCTPACRGCEMATLGTGSSPGLQGETCVWVLPREHVQSLVGSPGGSEPPQGKASSPGTQASVRPHVAEGGLLPSFNIPTLRHFMKRQAWQDLRLRFVISHSLVAGQLYSMLPGSRHRRVARCVGAPRPNPPATG